jgi:glyoxylase-like metal-dependent hydrolase (beta-lactamase superfamily II)
MVDLAQPQQRLGWPWLLYSRPVRDPQQTAVAQVRRLGFATADVRDIVLTHLDLDHAGGLSDFPAAHVHVLKVEHAAAKRPRAVKEQGRYRTQQRRPC